MKTLKTFLIVILCFAFVCGLASCGAEKTAGEKAAPGDEETSAAVTEGETEETAQTEITETEPLTEDESETSVAETEPVSETKATLPEKTEPETATVSQSSESDCGEWGIAMSFEPSGAGKGKLFIRRLPGHGLWRWAPLTGSTADTVSCWTRQSGMPGKTGSRCVYARLTGIRWR